MTSSVQSTSPSAPSFPARFANLPVVVVGGLAAVIGALVLTAYGALIAALGVPMFAGELGADHADAITAGNFALGTVICTFWGTVLAVALARWATRPARTFLRASLVLLAVSLVFPLAASHTETVTRLCLALGHLIAAAVVIPFITGRLAHVHA